MYFLRSILSRDETGQMKEMIVIACIIQTPQSKNCF